MIKMYNVEVLSKFPVVQHFPFGSLFAWEQDPNASSIQASVHTSSQPKAATPSSTAPTARPQPGLRDLMSNHPTVTTAAPWATGQSTGAPWASPGSLPKPSSGPNQPMRAPWATNTPAPPSTMTGTAAPWAKGRQGPT